jgi:hypothetical protein
MKNFTKIILALTLFLLFNPLYAQVTPAIEWQKSYGGLNSDEARSVQQTTSGGFIVAGYSNSNDGDVTGNHGNYDYWILSLDALGNLIWQKSLGGSGIDEAHSIIQTDDGGFIVAGWSDSTGGDVTENFGFSDYWIVKLDVDGNIIWQKSFGGNDYDKAESIQQTSDGGFIVAGRSQSEVSVNYGLLDYWIVKLDASGNLVWQKTFGGEGDDVAFSIQQTIDNGYIVAGISYSFNGNVSGNHGGGDYWVIKLDTAGNLVWQKSFGGSKEDKANSVRQTSDGGYIVAGRSKSNDGDVSGNHGKDDAWIIRLDTDGNLQWQKSFGGSSDDMANSVMQTIEGGYIVAGGTASKNGDVLGNYDNGDCWIIKLDTNGNLQWQKPLGGSEEDNSNSIQQTVDGGFVIAGWSASIDGDVSVNHGEVDYWIVKLAADTFTAIQSISNISISLYPNPVQNELTIRMTSLEGEITISVYDLQGKMIELPTTLLGEFEQNRQAQINTAALANGFYTLQITNKNGLSEVLKFVKQE